MVKNNFIWCWSLRWMGLTTWCLSRRILTWSACVCRRQWQWTIWSQKSSFSSSKQTESSLEVFYVWWHRSCSSRRSQKEWQRGSANTWFEWVKRSWSHHHTKRTHQNIGLGKTELRKTVLDLKQNWSISRLKTLWLQAVTLLSLMWLCRCQWTTWSPKSLLR